MNQHKKLRTTDIIPNSGKLVVLHCIILIAYISVGIFALLNGYLTGKLIVVICVSFILLYITLNHQTHYILITDTGITIRKGIFRPRQTVSWDSIQGISRGTGAQPASIMQHNGQVIELDGLSWPHAKTLQQELEKRVRPRL